MGSYGTVAGYDSDYSVDLHGYIFQPRFDGVVRALYTFSENTGMFPSGLVLGRYSRFYGAARGGDEGIGTVFSITPMGIFTVIHSFARVNPSPLVQANDGNFYGTTSGRAGSAAARFTDSRQRAPSA